MNKRQALKLGKWVLGPVLNPAEHPVNIRREKAAIDVLVKLHRRMPEPRRGRIAKMVHRLARRGVRWRIRLPDAASPGRARRYGDPWYACWRLDWSVQP